MIFRILDIETIPDYSVWTRGETTYRLVPADDDDKRVRAVEASQFPPPHSQRVVAISYVDVSFDPVATPKYKFASCATDCRWSRDPKQLDAEERSLLVDFGKIAAPDVHYVSWNGRTFDLPVISMRSLKHGIACKWYYDSRDVRYRYSTEGHCDLMDFLADYGASRPMKLHDACRLVGLPGKTDMTGASIEETYLSTMSDSKRDLQPVFDKVARYCLQDSIQTALLWVRSRFHVGKVDAEAHNAVMRSFEESSVIQNAISIDWDRIKV